jgi:plastocyanin
MLRRGSILLVALLSLAACGEDTQLGNEGDEVDEPQAGIESPATNLDDCAEVSAAEGAPAGITMMDTFFEPPCLAVSSTQEITLANVGNLEHNFSVADGDIDIDVEPGEEETTDEIGTDLAAGTYRFFCEYHEGQGMVGALVVE